MDPMLSCISGSVRSGIVSTHPRPFPTLFQPNHLNLMTIDDDDDDDHDDDDK